MAAALLLAGGVASLVAALLHIACIIGGPRWYLALGAGEPLADAVARGALWPHLATLGIAVMLAVWGAYGLSGAGAIGRLPLRRLALVAIAGVYLARGAVLFWPALLRRPDRSPEFLVWSSAIVLAMGLAYAAGTALAWDRL